MVGGQLPEPWPDPPPGRDERLWGTKKDAHEQQFGALHAVSVVVALRDDVAGVGEAEADMVADADELPQYAVVADT